MADTKKEKEPNPADFIWVLPAAMALSIPLLAVGGGSGWVSVIVGLVLLTIVAGGVSMALMTHRHQLKIKELEAEARLREKNTSELDMANRILEQDQRIHDLRSELKSTPASPSTPQSAGQIPHTPA